MASAPKKERQEPASDPGDVGELTCFLNYKIGSLWRCYIDSAGEQLFTRRRAKQLFDHLKSCNSEGWQKIVVADSSHK